MSTSVSNLNRALGTMIRTVSERPDGQNYVPIVQHLDGEIAELTSASSEYERILELAKRAAA